MIGTVRCSPFKRREKGKAVRDRGRSIMKRKRICVENAGNVSSVGIPPAHAVLRALLCVQIPHRGVD